MTVGAAVDEAADFTGCACKTTDSFVSPTCKSHGGCGYFYMNTKQRNAMQSRWLQSLLTAASCTNPTPFLIFSPPFIPPTLGKWNSRTGLVRADIIMFAFIHSQEVESDATGA